MPMTGRANAVEAVADFGDRFQVMGLRSQVGRGRSDQRFKIAGGLALIISFLQRLINEPADFAIPD
jgi:hypothetical protein